MVGPLTHFAITEKFIAFSDARSCCLSQFYITAISTCWTGKRKQFEDITFLWELAAALFNTFGNLYRQDFLVSGSIHVG